MNRRATPPSYNTDLFNLVRLRLAQPTRIKVNPCQGFGNVSVSLGQVRSNRFTDLGQPPTNGTNTPVNINAWCKSDGDIKWALLGTSSDYDASGDQGILALDSGTDSAEGVGIQVLRSDNQTPLPITPEGSAIEGYRWIDTNLHAKGEQMLALDFLARYVKTGTVSPGTANGHATLVLSPK